jgi:tetrahydrodipicolinate N-succinyltransferase
MKTKLTNEIVSSVAEKLDEFSEVLSEDERAVLLGIFGLAESAITSAHQEVETESGVLTGDSYILKPSLRTKIPRLSDAFAGSFSRISEVGGGQVSDSWGVSVLCVSWSKDIDEAITPGELVTNPVNNIPGMKIRRS